MRWSLLLLALLVGCGSRPPAPTEAPAGGLRWTSVTGGAWIATCAREDGFIALRAGGLDRWRVPSEGPLRRARSLPLSWPLVDGPGSALRCARDGAEAIFRTAGAPLLIADDTLAPTEEAGTQPEPHIVETIEVAGRTVSLNRSGWALMRDGVEIERRGVAGDFTDATWDGETLWAVGPTGLWRWSADRPRLVYVPLPGGERAALVRVWRDGPFVWVVDDSRVGRALDLRAGLARLAARPGPVRLTGPERTALVAGRLVSVVLRGETLMVDGTETALSGRVGAFTPLGGREILLGVGDAIERWDVTATPARQIARWHVGDATRRIIVDGERVFAAGGYGLLMGMVSDIKPAPVAPTAGPSGPPAPAADPTP